MAFSHEGYTEASSASAVRNTQTPTTITVQQQRTNGDKYGARTTLRDPQDMGAKPRCGKCLPQSWRRYRNVS